MEVLVTMKKIVITISLFIFAASFATKIFADSAINNGINYLGTQLNGATGQIVGGPIDDASPWAAIAFSANGKDPSTVKSSDGAPSLVDYLRNNSPTTCSTANEWEKWILAIIASGQNPYNFGGINYIGTLESSAYYTNNQIEYRPGDTIDIPSDWFGIMALIAGGVDKTDTALTDNLSFIISHQNSDGGFGYSTDPAAGSDGDDTAAAIQALVDARNYGVDNASLSAAIVNAKAYLLSTQDSSTGGFLAGSWATTPDSDSTTWALMALNVLGMINSDQANSARTWLISQQSSSNEGFTAATYDSNPPYELTGYASNSYTTSNALIGLAGKGWVLGNFDKSESTSLGTISPIVDCNPTPTPTDTLTPTPAPTSIPSNSGNSSSPTATPTPTSTPTVTPTPTIAPVTNTVFADTINITTPTPTPLIQSVLGSTTQNTQVTKVAGAKNYTFPITFGIVGLLFLLAGVGKIGYKYFWRN